MGETAVVASAIRDDGARVDVAANGFRTAGQDMAFFRYPVF